MKTVLFYGDSNTWGYDPRGFGGGRYPSSDCWTERAAEALRRDWKICVDAMNGREIPDSREDCGHVLEAIRAAGEGQAPDLFAVMLGTNDLFQAVGISPSDVAAGKMEDFLDRVMAAFPGMPVLLIAPPLVGSENSVDPVLCYVYGESCRLDRLYQALAEERGISCVSAADWNLPMAYDEVHLSEAGHHVFAEKIIEVLKKI